MRTSRHQLLASCLLLASASCRDETTNTGTPDLSVAADLSTTTTADLATAPPDMAQSPDMALRDPSDFMVVRVGDGTAALTAPATAVFIDRHKIADGVRVGTAIPLPTAVNGANKRLTLSGTAVSEGALTRSANGAYVVLVGYDAMLTTASLTSSTSSTINRVIGRIAADNTVDTSTAFDGLSGASPRGAASTNGTMMWATGGSGMIYTTFGSTAAPVALSSLNSRVPGIFFGQLYVTSGSGANVGVNTVGNGLPTAAGATTTLLSGFSAQANLSNYGFVALDRDATPGIDTLYVADDRTTGGGVQRWRLSGTTWMYEGSFAASATTGARAVSAYANATGVVLVAVITEGAGTQSKVVSFLDTGQTPSTAAAKDLVTAPANTSYRGLAFAPE